MTEPFFRVVGTIQLGDGSVISVIAFRVGWTGREAAMNIFGFCDSGHLIQNGHVLSEEQAQEVADLVNSGKITGVRTDCGTHFFVKGDSDSTSDVGYIGCDHGHLYKCVSLFGLDSFHEARFQLLIRNLDLSSKVRLVGDGPGVAMARPFLV